MRISIITVTLQAERFLADCIESVRSQNKDNFEIEHLIVDGGSSDRTIEIARGSGCTVLTGKDAGVFDAMNKGVRASSGEIIGFLNADDALLPGALMTVAEWGRRRDSAWMVGGVRWIDARGRSLGHSVAPPSFLGPRMHASLGWSCMCHQATFMTREFFDELGGFDLRFRYAGDYDLLLRALQKEKYFRSSRRLAAFRRHGGNLSLSDHADLRSENRLIRDTYGPKSVILRGLYRQALRVWLNCRNPSWFLGKKAPRLVQRLQHGQLFSDPVQESATDL